MMGISMRHHPLGKKDVIPRIDIADVLARAGLPPRREVALLSRLATHIGAGLRLRRRLEAAERAQRVDEAEAILTPSGKLEHAAGPAQEKDARAALASATRAVDRARGKLRRADPDEAVALWRTLVSGRWSLIDHFDHDGRRYVVAHRNQMLDARATLSALSDRERQAAMMAALGHTNKLIAYELGVSLSAVASYLARATQKLGASSRVGMIQILNSLGASPGA
jgi:DNA-binding CsgD family transcriptional regulator